MRLVTFNILHGRSPERSEVDIAVFADAIKSLGADVLALQEVDRNQVRSGRADLTAVAAELSPASERFYADLQAYAPAAEIYEANTRLAAERVHDLVSAGVAAGALRPVHAGFVGTAVAQVMTAIQGGRIAAGSGMADAEAYRALADLVVHGVGGSTS